MTSVRGERGPGACPGEARTTERGLSSAISELSTGADSCTERPQQRTQGAELSCSLLGKYSVGKMSRSILVGTSRDEACYWLPWVRGPGAQESLTTKNDPSPDVNHAKAEKGGFR